DTAVRVERATALEALGKNDQALADLDAAATAGPESVHALELRAKVDFEEKKFDKAVPALEKASALDPRDPNLPALLGHAYLETRDYANAVKALSVAYHINPKATDVLGDLVAAEFSLKNYAATLGALEALEKQLTLPAQGWFVRGACYDKLGQLQPALDAYRKFLAMNKDENNDMYFEASARARTLERELAEKKR
ncbi:MAG: tetratricopeptide repeat protein, partial [Candidatus Acidiferrales bacterium]